MDVNRSLKRFPPGIAEDDRPGLQDQLTRLIVRVLLKHRTLHYYQVRLFELVQNYPLIHSLPNTILFSPQGLSRCRHHVPTGGGGGAWVPHNAETVHQPPEGVYGAHHG